MSQQQLFARSFPRLLKYTLDEADKHGFNDIIYWSPDGKQFHISDIYVFGKEVLPKYFSKQSNAASFTRQLNLWGFERVKKKRQKSMSWKHQHFIRDDPDRIKFVKRRSVKDVTTKRTTTQTKTTTLSPAQEIHFIRHECDAKNFGKGNRAQQDETISIRSVSSQIATFLKTCCDNRMCASSASEAPVALSGPARNMQRITHLKFNHNDYCDNNQGQKSPCRKKIARKTPNTKTKTEKIIQQISVTDASYFAKTDDSDESTNKAPTNIEKIKAGRKGEHLSDARAAATRFKQRFREGDFYM